MFWGCSVSAGGHTVSGLGCDSFMAAREENRERGAEGRDGSRRATRSERYKRQPFLLRRPPSSRDFNMLYLFHLILFLPLAVLATLNEPCLGSGGRPGT